MPAHIACRPATFEGNAADGCFVICAEHGIRYSFGFAHDVARAACVEHNAVHHADSRPQRPQLLSVVYESAATVAFDESALAELFRTARAHNRAFGITGMLLAEDGRFLQAIEGPALIVSTLMETIRTDPRHRHVRILEQTMVSTRRFPDWAMAEGCIGELEALPIAQYCEGLLAARRHGAERRARLVWAA